MANERLQKFTQINILTLLATTLFSAFKQIGKPIKPYEIETDQARFILLMGVHGIGKYGQEARIENYLKEVDAVFLETGSFNYFNEETGEFEFPQQRFEEMAFYHYLFPKGILLKFSKIEHLQKG